MKALKSFSHLKISALARTRFLTALAVSLVLGLGIFATSSFAQGSASSGGTAETPAATTAGSASGSAANTPAAVNAGSPSEKAPATTAEAKSGAKPATKSKTSRPIHEEILPLLILLVVIVLVIRRLPKVEVGHSAEFKLRRLKNWLPLGLAYAFLYMARYNLTVLKDINALSGADFGDVKSWGSLVYGLSFLLNGPLTDRWGGRATILIALGGALTTNAIIGILMLSGSVSTGTITILYCVNMYFQSFGAVSIVKVNAPWFHVRERGTFGGIFGILISLGLYFAFDWGTRIAEFTTGLEVTVGTPAPWLFLVPAAILAVFWGLCFVWVRDSPSRAGLVDFDPQDASSGQSTAKESAFAVMKRMLTNKIILVIAFIELCSGFLRQGLLDWYRDFHRGIAGGIFAGFISDHLFGSRRAPVSAFLYMIMLAGACLMLPLLGIPAAVSWIVAIMAMAIIGVHGMLSGVASQDFGGKNNAGVATGLIDGFVYLGSAMQAKFYGATLPAKGSVSSHDTADWNMWPIAMIPMAVIGLGLSIAVWNARPGQKKTAEKSPLPKAKVAD
jgi:MFS transporter, OPA family, glycerol-3-phosphate transporter